MFILLHRTYQMGSIVDKTGAQTMTDLYRMGITCLSENFQQSWIRDEEEPWKHKTLLF